MKTFQKLEDRICDMRHATCDMRQIEKSEIGNRIIAHRISRIVLTVLLCLSAALASAQYVSYDYDDSGNRTSRTIIMPLNAPPPSPDSTEIEAPPSPPEGGDVVAAATGDESSPLPPSSYGDFPHEGEESGKSSLEVYTDVLSETQITIYPNPTRGLLTVKIANMPQHSASSLTLFDMQGRVITQKQPLAESNQLDISTQPPGTYIMQIAVGEEATGWRVVKF